MNFLHRTWAEIDIRALEHNYKLLKNACLNTEIMAVVKADAYGHSAKDIAPVLQKCGVDKFAVSNIEEAIQLRTIGINSPILILGYTPPELAKSLYDNDIIQTVYSLDYASDLSQSALKNNVCLKAHIKLDTGMGRIGFDCRSNDFEGFEDLKKVLTLKNICFDGIFTHFSCADDHSFSNNTKEQYSRFLRAIEMLQKAGYSFKAKHCCNSAASLLNQDMHSDICRAGIILYGLSPNMDIPIGDDFIPVMTVKSVVSMVKEIKKGDSLGYGMTYVANKNMRVATVTAGYADGYPRKLSNKGYVLIKGKPANIVGRISMDQMTVDISNIDDVKIGDEVVLFGRDLSVDKIAQFCDTINYEIVCGIPPRVPRVIIK